MDPPADLRLAGGGIRAHPFHRELTPVGVPWPRVSPACSRRWQHAGQLIDTGDRKQITPLPSVLLLTSPSQNYTLLIRYLWVDSLRGQSSSTCPTSVLKGALETNAAALVALWRFKDEGVTPPAA